MSSSVVIGHRTKKTKKNIYGYQIINKIPRDEACVLYLGGDGTTDDRAANSQAKIIEKEILPHIDVSIPIYSTRYNFATNYNRPLSRKLLYIQHRTEVFSSPNDIEKIKSKATEEEQNPQYIDDIFSKTILPRILPDENKTLLSAEEIMRNIRKMTIVAHCHGAFIALKLEEKMQHKLKELGYTAEERKKIQQQMLVIAHSPSCPLGISNSQFISFQSIYDLRVDKANNWLNSYITKRLKEERQRFNAEQKKSADVSEYRWFKFKPCYLPKKQGNVFLFSNFYEWNTDDGPFSPDIREHSNTHYILDKDHTPQGRCATYLCRNILQNGILNSMQQQENFTPLPPINKLILGKNSRYREKDIQLFIEMEKNGRELRDETYRFARTSLRNSREY